MLRPVQGIQTLLNGKPLRVLTIPMSNAKQNVLKARGIDKMLEEARDDHKENDGVHMRKCTSLLVPRKIARELTMNV